MSDNEKRKVPFGLVKKVAIVMAAILCFGATIGGAYAFLSSKTDTVENTYLEANVGCEVNQTTGIIKNTSNIPVRMRVALVINWLDSDGAINYVPASSYQANIVAEGWSQANGYYYYNGIVAADAEIAAPRLTVTNINGLTANVTMLAEAIQATPDEAALDAWGYDFD